MKWIMSDGGPLICLEEALESSWGGVDQLTITYPGATSDYDRACGSSSWLKLVPLTQSVALVMGEGPMDTSTWRSPSGCLFIVQVFFAEADIDECQKLVHLDEAIFDSPRQSSEWQIFSSPLVLFDSAMPGSEAQKESLSFEISPGRYRIQTQRFTPDDTASFLLHRFKPID